MSGNISGGKKAAKTNKKRYGKDFYHQLGKKGGQVQNPNKGFGSATPEQRAEWGRRGGTNSRKHPKED